MDQVEPKRPLQARAAVYIPLVFIAAQERVEERHASHCLASYIFQYLSKGTASSNIGRAHFCRAISPGIIEFILKRATADDFAESRL